MFALCLRDTGRAIEAYKRLPHRFFHVLLVERLCVEAAQQDPTTGSRVAALLCTLRENLLLSHEDLVEV